MAGVSLLSRSGGGPEHLYRMCREAEETRTLSASVAITMFCAELSFTQVDVCVTLRGGIQVSYSKWKARQAMILLMLACSVANADSIGSSSGGLGHRSGSTGVPLHQYAAKLTGFSPFLSPSLWINPRPRTLPARFLLPAAELRPLHSSSVVEQTIDLVQYFFQQLVTGREIRSSPKRNK